MTIPYLPSYRIRDRNNKERGSPTSEKRVDGTGITGKVMEYRETKAKKRSGDREKKGPS